MVWISKIKSSFIHPQRGKYSILIDPLEFLGNVHRSPIFSLYVKEYLDCVYMKSKSYHNYLNHDSW